MVIRGKTRGNGRQLAQYLLTMAENEHIEILDIDGRDDKSPSFLHQTLLAMSLTSELSKRSNKGLYHAQINPAYGDDKNMTPDMWQQAADMLGAALKLENQRRVIVLHTKLGRTHAHVVWQRYDLEKGKMISNSFSRLAQNRVRLEMEKAFEHQPTPEKNMRRPEMKEALSKIWQQTKTGAEFIKEAKKAGYIIAATTGRRPFMVVDEQGRSFDLVRQLEKVVTKEVRERLKDEKLQSEKVALKSVKAEKAINRSQEKMIDAKEIQQEKALLIEEQQREKRIEGFAETKDTALSKGKMTGAEKDRIREETLRVLREMQQNRSRDKGRDFDL